MNGWSWFNVRWRNSHIHEKQKRKVKWKWCCCFWEKSFAPLHSQHVRGSKTPIPLKKSKICVSVLKKLFLTFHTSPPRHDAKMLLHWTQTFYENLLWPPICERINHSVNFLSQKNRPAFELYIFNWRCVLRLILKKCESILILFPCCFLIRKMKYLPVNVLCCCKPAAGSKRSNPSAAPF